MIYRTGEKQNTEESFKWFKKAAEREDEHPSFFQVGRAYETGIGTDISAEQAFHWYAKNTRSEKDNEFYNEARNALSKLSEKREFFEKVWFNSFHLISKNHKDVMFELILVTRSYLSKDLVTLILTKYVVDYVFL